MSYFWEFSSSTCLRQSRSWSLWSTVWGLSSQSSRSLIPSHSTSEVGNTRIPINWKFNILIDAMESFLLQQAPVLNIALPLSFAFFFQIHLHVKSKFKAILWHIIFAAFFLHLMSQMSNNDQEKTLFWSSVRISKMVCAITDWRLARGTLAIRLIVKTF